MFKRLTKWLIIGSRAQHWVLVCLILKPFLLVTSLCWLNIREWFFLFLKLLFLISVVQEPVTGRLLCSKHSASSLLKSQSWSGTDHWWCRQSREAPVVALRLPSSFLGHAHGTGTVLPGMDPEKNPAGLLQSVCTVCMLTLKATPLGGHSAGSWRY